MYKVLIVDDETLIRDGLKCIMDWEEMGFTVCGEAGNGEDALSLIIKTAPHLVLMDIRMPKLQGLDVVRLSREQGFQGKFIIISGYSDFKYAQEAIRYGVESYLTKPIDEDELSEAVQKIKEDLDAKSLASDHIELYRQKAKDVILHELVLGTKGDDYSLSQQDMEELELESDIYQIVIYENFNRTPGSVIYSFADLLKVTNRENHTFHHFEEDQKDVILLKGTYALNRFLDFLSHYNSDNPPQKDSPMDSLFLAYGRPVNTLSEVHLSYKDAAALMRRRFFCIQGQHTLGYEDLPDINAVTYDLQKEKLQEYTDYLVGYLQTFNRKNVAETLSRLEDYLYNVDSNISEVKLFLTDLYLRIKEKISLIYNNISIPFATNSSVIDFIEKKHYMYEIIQFLSEQFEMIMNATGNPSRNSVLDDILYYIDHNYQNNIKLETIAPLFGYNSAYLGKIFNKTVGENFNSYVDHMRIEHSKELLIQSTGKVYEIAEKVGYRNVDYFHKKFRKYVGESPAEFRKKNGIAEE
ncbi:MAG: response regulator transcription factor [Lachnospiraceae bacterium]|nr:response regulator transcription factor [Lachnospiraceae bacterium]